MADARKRAPGSISASLRPSPLRGLVRFAATIPSAGVRRERSASPWTEQSSRTTIAMQASP